MKRIVNVLGLAVLLSGVLIMAAPAFAEDAKPTVSADDIKKALGMSIYVQAGYTYNPHPSGNATSPQENDLRWLDHKADSFGLDLAELVFVKDPPAADSVGFKLKLATGETAKLIHAGGLGSTTTDVPFDVTEAYVSYLAPIGKGLRFDFGKMATFIGAEVMEAKDDPNYSRSFLFNYAEPLTHTGLKTSYNFTDTFNAALFIVNGWNNANDTDKGKSVGVSVGYSPSDLFSGSVNVITGPESVNNSATGTTSARRSLLDIVATIKPIKPLSLIFNIDDGKQDDAVIPAGTGDAKWYGISGIAKYDISDKHSVAARAEYYNDKDGFTTGTVQKLKEVTLTWETRMRSGLIIRPEYRHDSSDKDSFDNNTKKKQDTLALGVMYNW
jgi:hypothetical protein